MPTIEVSAQEWDHLLRLRKYRNGCLHRVWWWDESMTHRWCVQLGDGRAWFGETPRAAWEAFARWARLEHILYRGPAS